jgi:hypothetical protein
MDESNSEYSDSDTDLAALWSRFISRFSVDVQVRLQEDFPSPESFFGLEHDSVAKYLKEAISLD